jgi:hypothetical protein
MENLTNNQAALGVGYKTANLLADLDSNFTEHEVDLSLLAPKTDPIFTGSVTIPDPPTNANDAASKNYVDNAVLTGNHWVDPVEDIVIVLPADTPTIGKRFIFLFDSRIYTADGANGWDTPAATPSGTTTYVKADTDLSGNSIGWYNFNGTDWVYIGASGNHNDLTSIQGGGGAQYYHLTDAQHTVAIQASTDALNGYLSAADHTTFAAKAPTTNPTFTGTVTVPNTSFVYAKLQNASANVVLGRTGVAGVVEEISCTAAGRALIDDATAADQRTTIGLGLVTNESKATMFTNPTFTGTVVGVTKAMVGLSVADNTSDANKPVSTATQTALNLKANIASPTLTGVPAAPTAGAGTNTTQIATTAFVTAAVAGFSVGATLTLTDGVSTFRFQVRGGSLCKDQTITPLGFAGTQPGDWDNISEDHL